MRPIAEKVFAKKIDEVDFHLITKTHIVEFLLGRKPCKAELQEAFRTYTLGQVVEKVDRYGRRQRFQPLFARKLLELGLTRIDWMALPQKTVSPEDLGALPRKELCALSAEILGIQAKTVAALESILAYDGPFLTVGNLLLFEVANTRGVAYYLRTYNRTLTGARDLLRQVLTEEEVEHYRFISVAPEEFDRP